VENKFDYLLFLAEAFAKQVSYDLNDLHYADRFSRINKDLDSINVLQKRLNNPEVVTREPRFGEARDHPVQSGVMPRSTIIARDSLRPEIRVSEPPQDSALELVADKWKSLNESKVEVYYYTWQKNDSKSKETGPKQRENQIFGRLGAHMGRLNQPKEYFLAITVISAENLMLSSLTEAPNAMFRASFCLYSIELQREIAKQYSSDVVPRQSNPEWNFQMNFQFTDIESFLNVNHDKEICIELIHLKAIPYSTQSVTEEHIITSLTTRLFNDFTDRDVKQLLKQEVMEIRKDLVAYNQDGVKVNIKVEILTNGESLENPFREEMINNLGLDQDRGIFNLI
jgi:hypothetical protein